MRTLARLLPISLLVGAACSTSEEPVDPQAPVAACVDDAAFFSDVVWPQVLQNKCLGCHNAQGIARETEFVMMPPAQPGYMEANRAVFGYLASLERDGTSFILLKPTKAIAHEGGKVIEEGSDDYNTLQAFAHRVKEPVVCDEAVVETSDPFAGVEMMNNGRVLRRAILSLAGRLPNADEYEMADRLGDTGVEIALLEMMKEPAFLQRIKEMFNDILLTDRFLGGNNMLERLDRNRYPAYWAESTPVDQPEQILIDRERRRLRELANNAAARSALELIAHVVRNDLPFTEILTANYMMVNAFSARSYGVSTANGAFADGDKRSDYNAEHFFPVTLDEVPHAGILSTSAWLNRFPTTATNRNRHRAWVFMKRFLATDILRLADRPVDPTSSRFHNPTMNDPQCTVCHATMDPAAGAFQNWDTNGQYHPPENGWYGEMEPPAFADEVIPPEHWGDALPWFAQRTVTDARFPLAITHVIFEVLIGEEPMMPPADPSAEGAALQQAKYDLQTALFDTISQQFVSSSFNLKALIAKVVLSPYYRAQHVDSQLASEAAGAIAGSPQLLSPENLDRKLKAVTGFSWKPRNIASNQLLVDYRLLYGGIDSNGVTKRLRKPNGLMANIGLRMANEVSCWVTAKDFTLDKDQRRLYPKVERSFEPETDDGFPIPQAQTKIKENIRYLFRRVLDEEHRLDSAEVERAYGIFYDTWAEGKAALATGEAEQALWYYCRADREYYTWDVLPAERRIVYDRNYVLRSWMAVLTYMLADYRFLYE